MNYFERFSEWKKMVKELPAKESGEMLFEFYRVNCNWITDTNPPDGMTLEMCQPPHKRATHKNLASVCATYFGAGAFVALEVAEGLDGLPLSYWIIKVKASDQCSFERVFLDEQRLRPYRQTRYLIPTEEEGWMTLDEGRPYWAAGFGEANIFWQRGGEAALAAGHLKELPDPENIESLPEQWRKGIEPTAQVNRADELLKANKTKKEIVNALIAEFGETSWRSSSVEWRVKLAETAIASAKQRQRRKRRKKTSS